MRIKIFFSLIFILGIFGKIQAQKNEIKLMPLPVHMELGSGIFYLDKDFSAKVEGYQSDRILKYTNRVLRRIDQQTGIFFNQGILDENNNPDSAKLTVKVNRKGELEVNEDESYTLSISPEKIVISAETDLGAMHGLETLSQLVEVINGKYAFETVKIEDTPRFTWRGLMYDVARHFIPIGDLKRNIDLMASVKLNVFHWHLVDDQGFRVQIDSHPELYLNASDGDYYTKDQIRDLVAYAADRGIRVVPEVDVPGHGTAILTAMPQLASKDTTYTLQRNAGIFTPVLDPTNPEVYKVLDDIIGEMSELFPDKYFHIGGDENEGKDWESNPEIVAFMKDNKLAHPHDLQAYFNVKLYPILKKYNKEMMGWEEIQNDAIPKSALIQSWRGVNEGLKPGESLNNAVKKGYQAILSNGFYIDLLLPASSHYTTEFIPDNSDLTDKQKALILGGEATMWSELLTPLTLDSRVWPRSAAIAEKFWSPREKTKDVDDMYRRLDIASKNLERVGSLHLRNQEVIIRNISNYTNPEALKVLVDVCEPMKVYSRNPGGTMYKSYSPYTKFADATVVDARGAKVFAEAVKNFVKEPNAESKAKLKSIFTIWSDNHEKFKEILAVSPMLIEVNAKSENLKIMGELGLKYLEYGNIPATELKNTLKYLDEVKTEEGGRTNLVVSESMKEFLKALKHK